MSGTRVRQVTSGRQACGWAHVRAALYSVGLVAVAVATLLVSSPAGAVSAPPQLCDLEPFGSPPRPIWHELAPPGGSGYPDYIDVTNNLQVVNSIQLLASIATRAAQKLQDLSSQVEDPEAVGRCVCCVGLSGNCPVPEFHLNVKRQDCTASSGVCTGPLEITHVPPLPTDYPIWLPTDLFKNPGNVARFALEYIGFLDDLKNILNEIQSSDPNSALVKALKTFQSGLANLTELVAKLEGFHCKAPDDPTTTTCTRQTQATDCPQSQECISYIDELTEGYHLGGYSTERPDLHLCVGYGGHGAFAEMANLFGAVSIGSRYTSHNLSREHRAQFRSGGFGVTAFGHSLSLVPGIEANLQMDGFKLWDAQKPFGIDISNVGVCPPSPCVRNSDPCCDGCGFPLADIDQYDIFHLVDQSDVSSFDTSHDGCLQPGEFLIKDFYPARYLSPPPPTPIPRTWPRPSFPYDWEKQNTAVFGAGLNLPLRLTTIEKDIPVGGIPIFVPGATLFPKLTLDAGVDWTYEANGLRQRLQDAVNKNLPASLQLGPNDFERPMHFLQAADVSGDDGTSAFVKPRVAADLVVGIALAKYLTLGITASVGTSVDVEPAAHGGLHDLNIALTQTLLNSNPPPNLPCDPIIDASESKQCSNGLYVDAEDTPLSSGSYSCDTTPVVVAARRRGNATAAGRKALNGTALTPGSVAPNMGCADHGYCTRTLGAGPDGIEGTADDIVDVQHDTTFAACSGQAVCDASATDAGASCNTDADCPSAGQCVGGPGAGNACTVDADCIRGQCQTPPAPCVQISPAGYFTPYQCLIKTTPTITGWQGPGCHPLTVGFPSACGCQSESDCVAGQENCVSGACQSLSNSQPVRCDCDPGNPACTAGRTCADGGCLLTCTTTTDCAANQTCSHGVCGSPYGIPFAEQIVWQFSHTTKPQHAVSSYALSDIDTSVLLDAGLWIGLDLKLFKKLHHFDVLDLSKYWVLAAFNKSWYQAGLEARYQNDCDPAAGNTVTNWQPGALRVNRYNPGSATSGALGNAGTESQLLQWCANQLPSDVSDPPAPGEGDLATSVTDLANWGEDLGLDAWSQAGLCVTQQGAGDVTSRPLTQWLTDQHNNPGGFSCAYSYNNHSVVFPCNDLRNQLLLIWGCLDVTANPWGPLLQSAFPSTVTTVNGTPVFDLGQMLIDPTAELNFDNLNASIRSYQFGLSHPGVYWYSAVTQCFEQHYGAVQPGDVQILGLSIGPCCGNGVLDREGCSAGPGGTPCESCDDGNTVGGDGCNSLCQIEGRTRPLGCGDGIVQPGLGESCDDGNTIDGDGCDSNCTPTGCGNGIVTAGEQCDDGNHDPLDGCQPDCTLPKAGVSPTVSPTPTPSGPVPPTATVTRPPGSCIGDCDGSGAVTVDELITGVNIALGSLPLSACRVFDANGDGEVTVDELIRAVNAALIGCSAAAQ